MMATSPTPERFHFLHEDPEEDGDEFLESRLSYILDRFSYDKLSGCSVDELNNQIELYNVLMKDTREKFLNPDFAFAEEPGLYEYMTGEELEFYEPLTPSQRKQIASVASEVNMNFDKAREDARDRKYERLSMLLNSIPVINRLKAKR